VNVLLTKTELFISNTFILLTTVASPGHVSSPSLITAYTCTPYPQLLLSSEPSTVRSRKGEAGKRPDETGTQDSGHGRPGGLGVGRDRGGLMDARYM
jgi:hypothetical protein